MPPEHARQCPQPSRLMPMVRPDIERQLRMQRWDRGAGPQCRPCGEDQRVIFKTVETASRDCWRSGRTIVAGLSDLYQGTCRRCRSDRVPTLMGRSPLSWCASCGAGGFHRLDDFRIGCANGRELPGEVVAKFPFRWDRGLAASRLMRHHDEAGRAEAALKRALPSMKGLLHRAEACRRRRALRSFAT